MAVSSASPGVPARARITVWSDYVCPFCYLEEPYLENVAESYGDRVSLEWRAFELRPEPVPTLDPDGEYLHRTWDAAVYPMAERQRMLLRLPPVQPRSRLALEAAKFARDRGRFAEMNRGLFHAFFEDGRDIGEEAVLLEVGASVGLDGAALASALRGGHHRTEVFEDEALARELGVGSVPTLHVGEDREALERALVVTGAQPYGGRIEAAVDQVLAGAERRQAV